MPRTRKPKPTDVPETILDQFAGPARPMSQAEVESITKRLKKALVERMLGGELVIPFFAFPPAIGRVLCTSNALESVHARLRRIIKRPGALPERRGRHEADLARPAQHHRRLVESRELLASGDESIRDPVR